MYLELLVEREIENCLRKSINLNNQDQFAIRDTSLVENWNIRKSL